MNEVAKIETDKTLAPKPELRAGGSVGAIVPQDAEQAYRMAQLIAKSGMAPRGMDQPEKIVTAIFHGLEVGLKPLQAVQSIAVVNGRPCIWGDAALGLVMGSGLLEDISEFIEGEGDSMVAVCRVQRKGMSSATERRFSVADAKKASLWGKSGPWQQYEKRMLQMRARAFALRDGFADVLKGLHVYEEVRDYSRPVPTGDSEQVTGQALIEQAAYEPVDEPAPDPEPAAVSHSAPSNEADKSDMPFDPEPEQPAEPAPPPTATLASDLVIPLTMKAPDGTKPDWIAFYNNMRSKAHDIGPMEIAALREANSDPLTRMAQSSRHNYDALRRILDDIEAA